MNECGAEVARRGTLRVLVGVAPGAGATHRMLEEGLRRAMRGADVIAVLDPTRLRPGHGVLLERLSAASVERVSAAVDVRRVVARHPDLVLVDDLHERTAPGATNPRRWQDIETLLAADIDVVSTTSAHRLASLRELQIESDADADGLEVPDAVLEAAAQVELIDISPEALRRRMAHGNLLDADHVDAVVAEFYGLDHLGALRERALAWMTREIRRRRAIERGESRPRVVVGLTGSATGEQVAARATELAERLEASIIGVHVRPSDGLTSRAGPLLEDQRRRVLEAGGTYHELVGDDVAAALAEFAAAERADHLVVGAPPVRRGHRRPSVAEAVVSRRPPTDVHVVLTDEPARSRPRALPTVRRRAAAIPRGRRIGAWLLCVFGLPGLTMALTQLRTHVSLSTSVLLNLSSVLAIAGLGGVIPGLVASFVAVGLINWYFVPPFHNLHVADVENVVTLLIFIAVASVVSALADRSARRSREARRARAEAAALASTSAALVGSSAPLQDLLALLRSTFGLASASVLERRDHRWATLCSVGGDPPADPTAGTARSLDRSGDVVLVLGGPAVAADDQMVLTAFIDQLAAAREAARLRDQAVQLEATGRSNALRSALLQAVSHDLRTPLASIKASASGLLRPDVEFSDDDRRRLLSSIDRSADRLDRMVGNLLDMSRIQAGRLDLAIRPTALEEVVESALSTLAGSADVAVEMPELLPLVLVDAELLERSIANVISNALAWSPSGRRVRVSAALVQGRIVLRVVDNGPGIPPEARRAVFEPFQRSGDRSNDAGVGLGLAIARGFTLAMGGTLTLDDTPGGGLTVAFGLPVWAGPT